jgi:hypothetical protein
VHLAGLLTGWPGSGVVLGVVKAFGAVYFPVAMMWTSSSPGKATGHAYSPTGSVPTTTAVAKLAGVWQFIVDFRQRHRHSCSTLFH